MTLPPNFFQQQMSVSFYLNGPSTLPVPGTKFVFQEGPITPWNPGELAVTIPLNWTLTPQMSPRTQSPQPIGPGWQGMVSYPCKFQDYPDMKQLVIGAVVNWIPQSFDTYFGTVPGYLSCGIQISQFPDYPHGGGVIASSGLVYPNNWYDTWVEPVPLFDIAPSGVSIGQTAGGSFPATDYYVVITYVTPFGESVPSQEGIAFIQANKLMTVTNPPMSPPDYFKPVTAFNVYATTNPSWPFYLQNTSPVPVNTLWTEPSSGLVTGTATPPTTNTATPVFVTSSIVGAGSCPAPPGVGGHLENLTAGQMAARGLPCSYSTQSWLELPTYDPATQTWFQLWYVGMPSWFLPGFNGNYWCWCYAFAEMPGTGLYMSNLILNMWTPP